MSCNPLRRLPATLADSIVTVAVVGWVYALAAGFGFLAELARWIGEDHQRTVASVAPAVLLCVIGLAWFAYRRWRQQVREVQRRRRVEHELRAAADAAEIANRAKSEFVANMSHELRTPLNAIIGFSEIMKDQILGAIVPAAYRGYAFDIHESGQLLLSIINDILDLSRIEAGAFELRPRRIDIDEVLHSMVRIIGPRAEKRSIKVSVDIAADQPRLSLDERAIKQVLLNLLSNAVKFNREGGEVLVRAGTNGSSEYVISVADTGIGMDESDLGNVLRPFVQLNAAANKRYAGTGLGLPIVKSLVELHGGRLTLESGRNAGTTASIHLPAARVLNRESARPALAHRRENVTGVTSPSVTDREEMPAL